jgi:hypothetical protein
MGGLGGWGKGWGLLFSGDGGHVAVRGKGPNDRQSWADEMNMNKTTCSCSSVGTPSKIN